MSEEIKNQEVTEAATQDELDSFVSLKKGILLKEPLSNWRITRLM